MEGEHTTRQNKVTADKAFKGKDTLVVVKACLPFATVYLGRTGKFSAPKKEDAVVLHYDIDCVGEQLLKCADEQPDLVVDVEQA